MHMADDNYKIFEESNFKSTGEHMCRPIYTKVQMVYVIACISQNHACVIRKASVCATCVMFKCSWLL